MSPQPRPKKIGLREFLRGGYRHIKEPVYVMNRKRPVAVWEPVLPPKEVPSPTDKPR